MTRGGVSGMVEQPILAPTGAETISIDVDDYNRQSRWKHFWVLKVYFSIVLGDGNRHMRWKRDLRFHRHMRWKQIPSVYIEL